jgi:hypothetical protein
MTTIFPPSMRAAIQAHAASFDALEQYWKPAFGWLQNQHGPLQGKNIYDGHPYLFAPAFPTVTPAQLYQLAEAARTFAWSVFLYDPVMDDGVAWAEMALRGQALQYESYRILSSLFPTTSSFWPRFRGYLRDYLAACGTEQEFMRGQRDLRGATEGEALQMSIGKNGVARAAIVGLAALSGDDGPYQALVDSIDEFYTAHQIVDDLADWRKDLRARIPTLVLARVAAELPDDVALDERSVPYVLFARGQAKVLLVQADAALERAAQLASPYPVELWHTRIAKLRESMAALHRDVDALAGAGRSRGPQLALGDAPAHCPALAWRATQFVTAQLARGFAAVAHTALFPMDRGYRPSQEYLSGHALQHAAILDALHDVAADELAPAIRFTADALITAHDQDAGGWPYFTTLPELPPSGDVFGRVVLALLRAGHRDAVLARIEPVLAWLAEHGAVTTWLPAPARRDLHDTWIRDCWGAAPDVDSVALLARALHAIDARRFSTVVTDAVDWIEQAQAADGSWPCGRNNSSYATTWHCAELLAEHRPFATARTRARNHLLATRIADGGWATASGEPSDAVSTSYALLALCAAAKPGDSAAAAAIERGRTRLEALVEAGWNPHPVSALPIGGARGEPVVYLEHESATLTAAAVAQAVMAVARWKVSS